VKCPNCGRDIDKSAFAPGLTYCPYCGYNLQSSSEGAETDRMLFCPYCGQELISQANFCHHCGKKLMPTEKKFPGRQKGKHLLERTAKPVAKAIRGTSGQKRKIRKLYKQWAEYAELPREEIPPPETLREMPERKKMRERSPRTLYIVLGVAALILIAGIVILIVTMMT